MSEYENKYCDDNCEHLKPTEKEQVKNRELPCINLVVKQSYIRVVLEVKFKCPFCPVDNQFCPECDLEMEEKGDRW